MRIFNKEKEIAKCKNCKGTGFVNGVRKRDTDRIKPKLKSLCYYCGGSGIK